MTDILQKILARKREEIASLDGDTLRRAAEASPRPGDFLAAFAPLSVGSLKGSGRGRCPSLIAELKRASPSRGLLAPDLDLMDVAEIYAANGAAAISVLTDETFFLGSLQTLYALRFTNQTTLPLLRKDFIIDAAQLYETRANGADAVLLIAAALPDDAHLADLHARALELGLTPLVEVHDEAETARALRLKDLRLIGINNRSLATFETNLETTERLRPLIPAETVVVAESGIFTAGDAERLANAGVSGILVGEALITAPDIAAKVRELSGSAVIAGGTGPDRAVSA